LYREQNQSNMEAWGALVRLIAYCSPTASEMRFQRLRRRFTIFWALRQSNHRRDDSEGCRDFQMRVQDLKAKTIQVGGGAPTGRDVSL
jgi:hypothetical protein